MIRVDGTINATGRRSLRGKTRICVHRSKPQICTSSDEYGAYSIDVPEKAKVALVYSGDGLTPTLRAFVTGNGPMQLGNTRVASDAGLAGIARIVQLDLAVKQSQ